MTIAATYGFKPHPLHFLVEPLFEDPSYIERPMFGCRACYLYGRLALVLAYPGDEPWNGVLIPTGKEHHSSLRAEFPPLSPHPVLGKWLYLSEDAPEFEKTATRLVALIIQGDERIGVSPKERKKKKPAQRHGR